MHQEANSGRGIRSWQRRPEGTEGEIGGENRSKKGLALQFATPAGLFKSDYGRKKCTSLLGFVLLVLLTTNQVPPIKPNKAKIGAVIGGVAVVGILVLLFVPLLKISYEETYQTRQTKLTQYEVMERQQKTFFSVDNRTLQGGESFIATAYIKSGHPVQFEVHAQNTFHAYIYSSDGMIITSNEEEKGALLKFTPSISDNYRFVIFNPHDGASGLVAQSIKIEEASGTESWEELVTKSEATMEPVTKKRMVSKTVNLIDYIYGN